MAIYGAIHPTKMIDLVKYIHTIRLGAARSKGLGWKKYDEQYRLRKTLAPESSWADIDAELWLIFMSGPTVSPYMASSTIAPSSRAKHGKCFDFNFKGTCFRYSCSFAHSCLQCSGEHPSCQCHLNNFNKQTFQPRMPTNPQSFPFPNRNSGPKSAHRAIRPMGIRQNFY